MRRQPDDAGTRRYFLGLALGAFATTISGPALAARRALPKRTLALNSLHTGESANLVYWADGKYLRDPMKRLAWILRDHRTNEIHPIDPRLFDLLSGLRGRLDASQPFQVVSGYRSPATNALLAKMTDGVAEHSLHMQGWAIDIRVPSRKLSSVREAAMSLKSGGVGYYPRSNFVHVDVGRIRHWTA